MRRPVPMRKYSFSYLMSRSFKGFSRNSLMSIASVLILTSCLLVSGSFGLIIYNLYVNLNSLNELNEIVCMCNYDKIPNEELDDLYNRLTALPNVDSVKFTSREEALENMREKYAQHPQVLSRFNEDNNPYAGHYGRYQSKEKWYYKHHYSKNRFYRPYYYG